MDPRHREPYHHQQQRHAARPTRSWRWLRWLNAGAFVAQRLVNAHFAQAVGPASRRHETLLTPARVAFRIWGIIYALLSLLVIVDCLCPVLSFFSYIDDPLRWLFALTCVANTAWTLAFTHDLVNVATLVLVVQWLALAVLFLQLVTARREYGWSLGRFLGSELGLSLYFAWSSVATVISLAVSIQDLWFHGGYLDLPLYLILLALLTVLAIAVIVFTGDVVVGLVAIWALVGVAIKDVSGLDAPASQVSLGIRAAATQSAAVIAAFVLIAIAHKIHQSFVPHRHEPHSPERALPLLSEKTLSIDYGSTVV